MQSPTLPIQHTDVQHAFYASSAQPVKTAPTPAKTTPPLLINSLILLVFLGALGAVVYKKRRESSLSQRIQRLEKLWRLESYSPFEERQ